MTWNGLRKRLLVGAHRLQHIGHRLARPLTLGVRAVVIDGEGRVFLVRHSYTPGWHLPGGGVEPGESLRAALVHELEEEANIHIDAEPRLLGVYFNNHASNRDHVAVYVVRGFHQSAPRGADWEILETGFFALDALPQGVAQSTLNRLAEALEGLPPAEIW